MEFGRKGSCTCSKSKLGLEELCPSCLREKIQIDAFKKRIFQRFFLGALFDLIISFGSFITDIYTFVEYLRASKWAFAAVALVLLLLPTTVFTNVYLEDQHDKTEGNGQSNYDELSETSSTPAPEAEEDIGKGAESPTKPEIPKEGLWTRYKIRRKKNKQIIQKIIKYVFGTVVLRLIASFWYFKALRFGIRSILWPKIYIKMEEPDKHWSYALLVRLDFLQAALENAPMCCIQMYILLTEVRQNVILSGLTLTFSFLDFVRVATTIVWNANKGPVIAPRGCFESLLWKLANIIGWTFLYFSRMSCLALVIAISRGSTMLIMPTVLITLHFLIFAVFLRSKRTSSKDIHARKVFVTAFISLFFLPDLDLNELHHLSQLYYAAILLENTAFIIPWRGLDINYCDYFGESPSPTDDPSILPTEDGYPPISKFFRRPEPTPVPDTPDKCLLTPEMVVISVPAMTIIGIVVRLACANKFVHFKAAEEQKANEGNCKRKTSTLMNQRVSNIYQKNWAKFTLSELLERLWKMIRKDEPIPIGCECERYNKGESTSTRPLEDIKEEKTPPSTPSISSLSKWSPLRRSHSMVNFGEEPRTDLGIWGNPTTFEDSRMKSFTSLVKSQDFENDSSKNSSLKEWHPNRKRLYSLSLTGKDREFYSNLDVKFVQIETNNGPKILEMSWI